MSVPSFHGPWNAEFRLIEPTEFHFGDISGRGNQNEQPSQIIQLHEPFFIGIHLVTQSQWVDVMGFNPAKFQEGWSAGLRPIESISFNDILDFLKELNHRDGESSYLGLRGVWRLPSEAEWEYVAGVGQPNRWGLTDKVHEIDEYVWHAGNSGSQTHEIGLKKSNSLGIFDMLGNVFEWCGDDYTHDLTKKRTQEAFADASSSKKSSRGGAWYTDVDSTRVSARQGALPTKKSDGIGFRLVWSPQLP